MLALLPEQDLIGPVDEFVKFHWGWLAEGVSYPQTLSALAIQKGF
jgi:hypothetical protein